MSEQSQLGPSQDGSVLVDIGGDRGALVIIATEDLAGAEIEISAVDSASARTHVAIRERRGQGSVRYAGIFPSLIEGTYTVWGLDGTQVGMVPITGGHVTEFRWP